MVFQLMCKNGMTEARQIAGMMEQAGFKVLDIFQTDAIGLKLLPEPTYGLRISLAVKDYMKLVPYLAKTYHFTMDNGLVTIY